MEYGVFSHSETVSFTLSPSIFSEIICVEVALFSLRFSSGLLSGCRSLSVEISSSCGFRLRFDTPPSLREQDEVKMDSADGPFARILHETPARIIWVDGNLAGVHMAHNINESVLRVVVDEANHRG